MSETTVETPATGAPADAGGNGQQASPLASLLEAVRQVAESQKTVLDVLRVAGAVRGPAPALAEEVARIVSDLLTQRDAGQARSASRAQYVRQHMSDLPDAYRRLLPESDDPTVLSRGERDVRAQFRQDLRSVLQNTGASPSSTVDDPGGQRPAAAVDYSKLSPLEQITLGLSRAAVAGRASVAAGNEDASRSGASAAQLSGAD